MHVVMTVDPVWTRSIKPPELVQVGGKHVLKGANEAGMENYLGECMPSQVRSNFPLPFLKL